MRIFKILATITFVLSLSVPTFAQSSASAGASGSAGAAGSTAAASGQQLEQQQPFQQL